MALGLGHLHIPPEQFWRMTPRELFAAADGYLASKGIAPGVEPMTKADVLRMSEDYEKQQRLKAEKSGNG